MIFRGPTRGCGIGRRGLPVWGFTADSAAQSLCRGYSAALGHFPATCLVDAGRPALGIGAIVAVAGFICLMMARAALTKS